MHKVLSTVLLTALIASLPYASAETKEGAAPNVCEGGVPWVLPKLVRTYKEHISESFLRVGASDGAMMRVCNCSPTGNGRRDVWIRMQLSALVSPRIDELEKLATGWEQIVGNFSTTRGPVVTVLVREQSCVDVSGQNVAVYHFDEQDGRRGTYFFPLQ